MKARTPLLAGLLATGIAWSSPTADAQGSKPPGFGKQYTVTLTNDWPLSKLVDAYDQGSWRDVGAFLASFEESFNSTPDVLGSDKIDFKKDYYSVIFLDDANAADPEKKVGISDLAYGRVLYHDPPSADPFPLTVLDRTQFIEILIVPAERSTKAQSNYTVTRVENPLLKSAAKFFQKFIGAAVTGIAGGTKRGLGGKVVHVCIRTIRVPWNRCSIEIEDQPAETQNDGATELPAALEKPANPATKSGQKTKTQYTIEPSAKASFGVLTAGVLGSSLRQRVKTDNSVLAADPIKSPLTAAILNWQPWGYDPSLFSPSSSEKWRLLCGAAFSPEFGLVAGGGYSPIRGVAIDVGYSALLVNTLRSGDSIGKKPRNAAHPTRRGVLGEFFVGLGFSLE
jgi:hypothetical protein